MTSTTSSIVGTASSPSPPSPSHASDVAKQQAVKSLSPPPTRTRRRAISVICAALILIPTFVSLRASFKAVVLVPPTTPAPFSTLFEDIILSATSMVSSSSAGRNQENDRRMTISTPKTTTTSTTTGTTSTTTTNTTTTTAVATGDLRRSGWQHDSNYTVDDDDDDDADDIFHSFHYNASLPHAVFYNIYIPENRRRLVRSIVKEQMHAIPRSYLGHQAREMNRTLTIFYNTIGDASVVTNFMERFCPLLRYNCVHMKQYERGGEDVTLHRVHQFCRRMGEVGQADDFRVVYIHNKGSYNDKPYQARIRRVNTDAVLSKSCLMPTNTQCNLCGGCTVQTSIFPVMTANFFTATCDYVRKLIPPKQINATMESLYHAYVEKEREGRLQTDRVSRITHGLGRYSFEVWAPSHPSVMICDTDSDRDNRTAQLGPRWRYGYRRWHGIKREAILRVSKDPSLRHRDYHLLPGLVFRWYFLYGQAPPPDSWVWKWYPDGPMWRDAVQKYGAKAVEILTAPYTNATTKTGVTAALRGAANESTL